MTAVELRDLLTQVERHGGPVRVMPEPRFPSAQIEYGGDDIKEEHHIGSMLNLTSVGGSVCAALKRDLIERKMHTIKSTHNSGWGWLVEVYTARQWFSGTGKAELEAVLKAWLSAAKAEGWTA